MYYLISNALKKRLVLVFQEIFKEHPIFSKVAVITKFPEEERPKYALLIRSVSGSSQKIDLTNFVRINYSFSGLANLRGTLANSIEWVKDDVNNIDKLSAPGFYIVRITEKIISDEIEAYKFVVDPFLVVEDELLELEPLSTKMAATVKNLPMNPESEVVHADDGIYLKRNIDYTVEYDNGKIVFLIDITQFEQIFCDYQIIGDELGPFQIEPYMLDNVSIPGVILAFGDRIKVGDEQIVFLEDQERETAKVYGGRWQLSCDLVGISQDTDQQERIVDYAISKFWADWQDRLTDEGIHIHDFALSGEAEDLELDLPDEYNYTGGITFTAETDWELHVPIIEKVRRYNTDYGEQSYKDTISDLKEAMYEKEQFDTRMANAKHQLGIRAITPADPMVVVPTPIIRTSTKYPRSST